MSCLLHWEEGQHVCPGHSCLSDRGWGQGTPFKALGGQEEDVGALKTCWTEAKTDYQHSEAVVELRGQGQERQQAGAKQAVSWGLWLLTVQKQRVRLRTSEFPSSL